MIDDPGISRRHMEIDVTDNGSTVIARDLGSTNGMYVEGHHVEAATLLDHHHRPHPNPVLGLFAGSGVTNPNLGSCLYAH